MARMIAPKCKQCRRENMKLFLKGERCLTEKCAIERRAYPPGEHGRGRIKQSEYLLQLREKQKARRYYGILEKQFRIYYKKATKRSGITGENLLPMLDFIPKITSEDVGDTTGTFVVEPLDRGFGYTFGNSLRRVLLSSLEGAAVTSVKIEGVAHEFTSVQGVREDVTDVILNLKNL